LRNTFFVFVLVLLLVLEVSHPLIPSSRTRNSSGSKRSTKRVNIATIRASSSLPGQIRSLFVIRLATEAPKHAAHSKAEPLAVIEVSGSLAPLALSVSFGGIEQNGYGRSIELINQLTPA
jgi:hypothetical protein